MNTSDSNSAGNLYSRGESDREDLPTKLEPFDFGESPETVRRALERNSRLLYGDHREVRCDPQAVRDKIDELLDRLLEAGLPEPTESRSSASRSPDS
jgi:hypothetical protein